MNDVLSVILFVLSLLLEIYVAIKVKMMLDWSMIAIALAYMVSFLIRTPIFPESDLNLVHALASMVIWGIMYFFVFEMRRLQDTLLSQNLKERIARQRRTSIIALVVYIFFFGFVVSSAVALYVTKMVSKQAYLEAQAVFDVILIIRGVIKFCTDAFMFP